MFKINIIDSTCCGCVAQVFVCASAHTLVVMPIYLCPLWYYLTLQVQLKFKDAKANAMNKQQNNQTNALRAKVAVKLQLISLYFHSNFK